MGKFEKQWWCDNLKMMTRTQLDTLKLLLETEAAKLEEIDNLFIKNKTYER